MVEHTLTYDFRDCFGDTHTENAEVCVDDDGVVRWRASCEVPSLHRVEGMAQVCPSISVDHSEATRYSEFKTMVRDQLGKMPRLSRAESPSIITAPVVQIGKP